jgi:hypothetical protein
MGEEKLTLFSSWKINLVQDNLDLSLQDRKDPVVASGNQLQPSF